MSKPDLLLDIHVRLLALADCGKSTWLHWSCSSLRAPGYGTIRCMSSRLASPVYGTHLHVPSIISDATKCWIGSVVDFRLAMSRTVDLIVSRKALLHGIGSRVDNSNCRIDCYAAIATANSRAAGQSAEELVDACVCRTVST